MIVEIFGYLSEIVSSFGDTLKNIFTAAINLFYDTTETAITPVGSLMLIGLGTGLLIWGFKFIRRLIRVRTK